MSDKGLRCGKIVLGVRIRGFKKEVGHRLEADAYELNSDNNRYGGSPSAEGVALAHGELVCDRSKPYR